MNKNIKKLNIFISYSHKNMKYKEKLLISLEALRQSYNIEPWHDAMIDAGGNIDNSVKQAMSKAHIILLLITDSFIASHYCMKIELEDAIKREKQNKCIVIPVIFQESVLADTLLFFNHNRVPEDGKPIATKFKNQNEGCTHAVNMIKNLIDKHFPNCKITSPSVSYNNIRASSTKSPNIKQKSTHIRNNNNINIELIKDGKKGLVPVSQNMIDLIPNYFSSFNSFKIIMDASLVSAKKRYATLYKQFKNTMIPNEQKLNQLRLYLMDICAYTKTYITENTGIKVHFRVSKNNNCLGLIASTDDDDATDLASDWTIKMTPIPMYRGLIYYSSLLGEPLIKSLNPTLNFKGKHDDIWIDYVTFTFPKFHTGRTPLISYGISIHKDYYDAKSDMLKILAYVKFGDIIEYYIEKYCDICKNIDKSYDLEEIINVL